MEISKDSVTVVWVSNLPQLDTTVNETSKVPTISVITKQKESNFYLLSNPDQHKAMVEKLAHARDLPNEAEQIINNRRADYNKECREFKKLQRAKNLQPAK
jgi:hypothetical protein